MKSKSLLVLALYGFCSIGIGLRAQSLQEKFVVVLRHEHISPKEKTRPYYKIFREFHQNFIREMTLSANKSTLRPDDIWFVSVNLNEVSAYHAGPCLEIIVVRKRDAKKVEKIETAFHLELGRLDTLDLKREAKTAFKRVKAMIQKPPTNPHIVRNTQPWTTPPTAFFYPAVNYSRE